MLLHIPLFVALTYWQGTREKIYSDFYLYKRKYGKMYDTFSESIVNNLFLIYLYIYDILY